MAVGSPALLMNIAKKANAPVQTDYHGVVIHALTPKLSSNIAAAVVKNVPTL